MLKLLYKTKMYLNINKIIELKNENEILSWKFGKKCGCALYTAKYGIYTFSKYAKQAVMVVVYPVHWYWSGQIRLNDEPPILSELMLISQFILLNSQTKWSRLYPHHLHDNNGDLPNAEFHLNQFRAWMFIQRNSLIVINYF